MPLCSPLSKPVTDICLPSDISGSQRVSTPIHSLPTSPRIRPEGSETIASMYYSARLYRLPITPVILRRIRAMWGAKAIDPDIQMLWAALFGFFSFLRSGEFTVPDDSAFDPMSHLTIEDLVVDSHTHPPYCRWRSRSARLTPSGRNLQFSSGQQKSDLRPVAAVLTYLAVRPKTGSPAFMFQDSHPLTHLHLVARLREILTQTGVNSTNFARHSFRIRAAFTAAAKGVEDSVIKMLGRWESATFLKYIRIP